MSNKEELTITEDGEVDFDFGFENFRAMGFQFTGMLKQCRIKQPTVEEYSFIDKRSGNTVTKKAKPQLELLIEPLSFATKSGNPIPEYLPLTHNVRSKLGIFVEHLRNLGLTLGNDPSRIEGMVFEWETKEVDFGGAEPVKVNVPIEVSGATATGAAGASGKAGVASSGSRASAGPAPSPKFAISSQEAAALALSLHGVATGHELQAVARSSFGNNPRVIAGVADKTLITLLTDNGMLTRSDNGEYHATATG